MPILYIYNKVRTIGTRPHLGLDRINGDVCGTKLLRISEKGVCMYKSQLAVVVLELFRKPSSHTEHRVDKSTNTPLSL